MRTQLDQWDHMRGAAHAADRVALLIMAEGIDAARDSVASGTAALPLVNACKYALDTLRRLAPAASEAGDGFDEAMQWED